MVKGIQVPIEVSVINIKEIDALNKKLKETVSLTNNIKGKGSSTSSYATLDNSSFASIVKQYKKILGDTYETHPRALKKASLEITGIKNLAQSNVLNENASFINAKKNIARKTANISNTNKTLESELNRELKLRKQYFDEEQKFANFSLKKESAQFNDELREKKFIHDKTLSVLKFESRLSEINFNQDTVAEKIFMQQENTRIKAEDILFKQQIARENVDLKINATQADQEYKFETLQIRKDKLDLDQQEARRKTENQEFVHNLNADKLALSKERLEFAKQESHRISEDRKRRLEAQEKQSMITAITRVVQLVATTVSTGKLGKLIQESASIGSISGLYSTGTGLPFNTQASTVVGSGLGLGNASSIGLQKYLELQQMMLFGKVNPEKLISYSALGLGYKTTPQEDLQRFVGSKDIQKELPYFANIFGSDFLKSGMLLRNAVASNNKSDSVNAILGGILGASMGGVRSSTPNSVIGSDVYNTTSGLSGVLLNSLGLGSKEVGASALISFLSTLNTGLANLSVSINEFSNSGGMEVLNSFFSGIGAGISYILNTFSSLLSVFSSLTSASSNFVTALQSFASIIGLVVGLGGTLAVLAITLRSVIFLMGAFTASVEFLATILGIAELPAVALAVALTALVGIIYYVMGGLDGFLSTLNSTGINTGASVKEPYSVNNVNTSVDKSSLSVTNNFNMVNTGRPMRSIY